MSVATTRSLVTIRPRAVPNARMAGLLVAAALLFNFALCFLNTAGVKAGLNTVAAVQLLIIGLAALAARENLLVSGLQAGLLVLGWLCVVRLVNPTIELKIAVDVAMPIAFYSLGRTYGSPQFGDRLVWWLAVTVLAVGLFEMFALDTFLHYFNIFAYYVDKGALAANQASDTGTTLAENGMRAAGDGRALFPALGLHRVGSVFLEPISAGNFAVICVGWFLARLPFRNRWGLLLVAVAFCIGVLADARFSVATSLVIAAGLLSPAWRSRVFIAALPFVLVTFLVVFAQYGGMSQIDNSIGGRFFGSGRLLAGWDWQSWVALGRVDGSTFDTGYAYIFANIGILAAGALWVAVVLRRPVNSGAARFMFAIAIYVSLSLCVSASSLSIKTAALMWFLYGSLNRVPEGRETAT